jgi:hypothetical protein
MMVIADCHGEEKLSYLHASLEFPNGFGIFCAKKKYI